MGTDLLERPALWTPDAFVEESHAALVRGQRSRIVTSPIRYDQRPMFEAYLADWRERGWTKADLRHFRCAAANKTLQVASTGLTVASTAYSAADQVGAIFTHTNFGTGSGLGGLLTSAYLQDKAAIIGTYTAFLFNATVTAASDNAAYSISDADSPLSAMPPITFGQVYSQTLNRITGWTIPMAYVCAATSLFTLLRTEGAHTFFGAAGDLNLQYNAITV